MPDHPSDPNSVVRESEFVRKKGKKGKKKSDPNSVTRKGEIDRMKRIFSK